jgi:hypothetical protein
MLSIKEDKDLIKNINLFDKLRIKFTLSCSGKQDKGSSNECNINSHYSLEFVLNNNNAANDFFSLFLTKKLPVYSC